MAEDKDQTLYPTVLWMQRKDLICLRVVVHALEKPDFEVHESFIKFKVRGDGVSGEATYGFELVFYDSINTKNCRVKLSDTEIELRLLKKESIAWPRLQSAHERPHWLRIDFDRWVDLEEGGSEGEGGEGEENGELDDEKRSKISKMRGELEDILKEEMKQTRKIMNVLDKVRKAYLMAYNGIQWCSFFLIVTALLKCLMKTDGISTAYELTSTMLQFAHALMLLEILHAAFGLVRGGIVPTFLQVFGRSVILFGVVGATEEIQEHPVVFVLFLVWSLIEIVRYPFYLLSIIGLEWNALTWLRYTSWIPLYPIGFTCEATVIWLSIPYFEASGDYSYELPNMLNFSFYPPTILRLLLLIVPLIAVNQIKHMYIQRKNKLAKVKIM